MTPELSERIVAVVKASRPSGWCFGPILYAIGLIHSPTKPRTLTALFMAIAQALSFSFPLCTLVFGVNDLYDYHSDIRNPRKIASGLEGGVLAPQYHSSVMEIAQISTAIIFLTSLATFRPQNIFATTSLVFLGWQYSATPLRLKEVPVLDSLTNGLIVFSTWSAGYTFGRGSFFNAPRKGYILALCTAGVHALGAVMDIDSDIAARQRTIATFLGPHLPVALGALAFAISLCAERWNSIFGIYLWGGLIAMLIAFLRVQWAHQAFKAIVHWSVVMAMVWFVSKTLPRGVKLAAK